MVTPTENFGSVIVQKNIVTNPVNGLFKRNIEYCSILRRWDDECGDAGDWWEIAYEMIDKVEIVSQSQQSPRSKAATLLSLIGVK